MNVIKQRLLEELDRWTWDARSQWRGLDYLHFDVLKVRLIHHGKDEDFAGLVGVSIGLVGLTVSVSRYSA